MVRNADPIAIPHAPQQLAEARLGFVRREGLAALTHASVQYTQTSQTSQDARTSATISYDPESANYHFRSHLEDGRSGDYLGQLEDGAFIWGFEVPNGQIRFTIRIADAHWSETGECSADGEQWNQFFAMELDRKAD